MVHKAWSSIEEVPFCFRRSSIIFQGHKGWHITNFDPNWAFLDCKSSLNSPMDLKWRTRLDIVYKKCPIVFPGHPSNFTVTRAEKLTIWIQFEITRPVAAIKSLRFALLLTYLKMLSTKLCPFYSALNVLIILGLDYVNSLAPGGFDHSLKLVNFKLISTINIWSIFCEITIRWMPQYLTDR